MCDHAIKTLYDIAYECFISDRDSQTHLQYGVSDFAIMGHEANPILSFEVAKDVESMQLGVQ